MKRHTTLEETIIRIERRVAVMSLGDTKTTLEETIIQIKGVMQ